MIITRHVALFSSTGKRTWTTRRSARRYVASSPKAGQDERDRVSTRSSGRCWIRSESAVLAQHKQIDRVRDSDPGKSFSQNKISKLVLFGGQALRRLLAVGLTTLAQNVARSGGGVGEAASALAA